MSEESPSLSKLVGEFKAEVSYRWTPNTKLMRFAVLKKFVDYVGPRELTPKILAEWQTEQHTLGVSEATVEIRLKAVKSFIDWAAEMEIFARNRFANIIRIDPRKLGKKPLTFSPDQYERLKENSKGTDWYYAIVLAYRTGARYSDCALLKWENVNLDKCYVRYTPFKSRKTGREAICPFDARGDLHMALLDMGRVRLESGPWSAYVCPEFAMGYPTAEAGGAERGQRYAFARLCKQSGIQGRRFHNLRNSFISRLVKSGASFPMGSQLTGLQSHYIFNAYAEPDLDALRKVINKAEAEEKPPEDGTIIKLPGAA